MIHKMSMGLVLAMAALTGCSGGDDGEQTGIDAQLLAQYRAAVPSQERLKASAPEASVAAKVGDPAVLPQGSGEIVEGVNGAVTGIVDIMQSLVNLEPTLYNSDTKEVLWGPYPNEDGFGTVAAYVKDEGEGGDFRYSYALLRGVDKDVAKMKPVIWGGATPDPENKDHGAGVTLWDFEANHAFEEANNPVFASQSLDRGRFVAVYGKGVDEKAEVALVVSVFRGFVPKGKPGTTPVDLDYFYGRVADGKNTIDFIDWKSVVDVDNDPARPAAEKVGIHMAFLNEGTGRAEAQASEGDLAAGQVAEVVECWDASLAQSYISFKTSTNGVEDGATSEGDAASCGLFQAALADLNVPTLKDVDPELLADLDNVAKNGVPAE